MLERINNNPVVEQLGKVFTKLYVGITDFTAPITGDDLIQFRKYGTLRAVGGELRRNTLMCLVAISSQELIHHLH